MNLFIIAFLIISIILYLITHYYKLKKELKIESYNKSIKIYEKFKANKLLSPSDKLFKKHKLKIHYLDALEARPLIEHIKNDEYIRGMNQSNLIARQCINKDELISKYENAFEDITLNEKTKIDEFLLKLLNNINKYNQHYYNYVVKWMKTISLAKGKNWLESGMPHTLKNTIIMDASWFSNPRQTTLLHEITHIHQRTTFMDFEDLYASLGYIYNPVDIKGMESIYPLNRNNPDGTSKYWLWHNKTNSNPDTTSTENKTYWWIGAVFKTATPINLHDVNIIALKLEHTNDNNNNSDNNIFYYLKQNPLQLRKLKNFIDFFGENPNNYHPNEMIAKFAEWYLTDITRDISANRFEYENYEGYRIYKKYYENMLSVYY